MPPDIFPEAMKRSKNTKFHAVDLSETSIEITKGIIQALAGDEVEVQYHLADIFNWSPDQPFDVITMGEVLEHVERPDILLKRSHDFLAEEGRMFVTTCANCPAIDHVYLFKSADEIRTLIEEANFRIIEEKVLERDYGMRSRLGGKFITTQYAALVTKESP